MPASTRSPSRTHSWANRTTEQHRRGRRGRGVECDKPGANLSGKDVRTMWTLTLTNNYHSTVIATDNEGNHNVNPNSQYQNATPLGNGYLTIPGLGQANFIDIADSHIGGHGAQSEGVLIKSQEEAWGFRHGGRG